ncbi:MAG: phosphoribosylaminoimidazolesuccinocarboxamide synthase [Ardenticatenaceae bacterium]|nr:phosphoribosylaminoimidazolesuccinocarboxamide synthase [Ardenticatenaceae bacterium]
MIPTAQLHNSLPHCLSETHLDELGPKYAGKVRDVYLQNGRRVLVTTDRVSAFDRILGLIPYKGQVLNQLALWWFEQTADLVDNHVISSPDPNVTVAHEAEPIPIEVVVRGYITGVTKTSLWYLYEQGDRHPYGIELPDGLQKYDRLPEPIITPTTKAAQGEHDERITEEEILARQIVSPEMWQEIKAAAIAVFKRGQKLAAAAGLILVDTKYEMGIINGRLALIDEIHTPDSSRFWIADSWGHGREPENFDKEFLRKWYAKQGYRGDGEPPQMPDDFRVAVAERYIAAYEKLTGRTFEPAEIPAEPRIRRQIALLEG